MDGGFFAYSWGCDFVDASIVSFSEKDSPFKFDYFEAVNSWGRTTHNHEN